MNERRSRLSFPAIRVTGLASGDDLSFRRAIPLSVRCHLAGGIARTARAIRSLLRDARNRVLGARGTRSPAPSRRPEHGKRVPARAQPGRGPATRGRGARDIRRRAAGTPDACSSGYRGRPGRIRDAHDRPTATSCSRRSTRWIFRYVTGAWTWSTDSPSRTTCRMSSVSWARWLGSSDQAAGACCWTTRTRRSGSTSSSFGFGHYAVESSQGAPLARRRP